MRSQETLTLLMLAMGLDFALSAWAQQKPFTKEQVQGLVRDGLAQTPKYRVLSQPALKGLAGKRYSLPVEIFSCKTMLTV